MKKEFKLRPWDIADLDSLVNYANNWKNKKPFYLKILYLLKIWKQKARDRGI